MEICLFSKDYNLRPSSSEILGIIHQIGLDKKLISKDSNILDFKIFVEKPSNNLLKFFLNLYEL